MKSVLKRLLITASISFPFHAAMACSVPNSTDDSTRKIIVEQGGFPVSDAQCALLNQNHLSLDIDGDATVLAGVNVGWAVVRLRNSHGVVSKLSGTGTTVNTDLASQNTADRQFFASLKSAINSLDWKTAAEQVTSRAD